MLSMPPRASNEPDSKAALARAELLGDLDIPNNVINDIL
jgi:hypothetical protein